MKFGEGCVRRLLQPLEVLTLACLFACFFTFAGYGQSGGNASTSASLSDKPTNSTPSLEGERPAVNARINALSQAFMNKDVEAVLNMSTSKDRYRKEFQTNKDKMPLAGEILKSATLTDIGPGYTKNGTLIGEISVKNASGTWTINIYKSNGEWLFEIPWENGIWKKYIH